jgi:hypothetical protein
MSYSYIHESVSFRNVRRDQLPGIVHEHLEGIRSIQSRHRDHDTLMRTS